MSNTPHKDYSALVAAREPDGTECYYATHARFVDGEDFVQLNARATSFAEQAGLKSSEWELIDLFEEYADARFHAAVLNGWMQQ